MAEPEYIPISYLNALAYCPRRFYYEFVLGEMVVNEHVLEGALRHGPSDRGRAEREGETERRRRVYVYSEGLRLVGYVDVLESSEEGLCPVEYKKGRQGRWLNDQIQLCAQALCLEERLGQPIGHGYIFYFGSRHRQRVAFSPQLRGATAQVAAEAIAVARQGSIPPPLDHWGKCRHCSLEPLCLPREVLKLTKGA